jgi:hypothetical protein
MIRLFVALALLLGAARPARPQDTAAAPSAPSRDAARSQPPPPDSAAVQLPAADRVRLVEAFRLARAVGGRVWPGWSRTPMPVLLLTDSAEFLIGHRAPTPDFTPAGPDSLLGPIWTRRPKFPPTLRATFPAVAGQPTIVIGTAERTGLSSAAWVLTVMHEHFHQWQFSRPGYQAGVARLDLARGDTTGRWMLEYPFPYARDTVQSGLRALAAALSPPVDTSRAAWRARVPEVVAARDRLLRLLTPADARYFEFQLWQEGVARYIEYQVAQVASAAPPPEPAFRALPDYEPYQAVAWRMGERLRRELADLAPGEQQRVAWDPVGGARALLVDATRPDWKRVYGRRPFALAALLVARPAGSPP